MVTCTGRGAVAAADWVPWSSWSRVLPAVLRPLAAAHLRLRRGGAYCVVLCGGWCTILVDGVPISELNVQWLRSQIAVVSQTPVLFNVSLRDNIRMGRQDVSEEDIIAASKMAHSHKFITEFPDGYDTMAGDAGGKLSGGQKQRSEL